MKRLILVFLFAGCLTAQAQFIPPSGGGGGGGTLPTTSNLLAGDGAGGASDAGFAPGAVVQTTRTVNGHALSSDVTVSKGDVGLGNADNTADAAKPVSTAQQTALDAKAPLANPTFTGLMTAARIKGTAGSYTVTMNGANTASVKTCVGSDVAGLITLTMSSTGNTSASVCTISGFNWTTTPTAIILYGVNSGGNNALITTKALTVTSPTTTSFDLTGGSVGLVSGTTYTINYIAIQ